MKSQKAQEYKSYIAEHISNVQKAWKEVQEKCKDEHFVYDDWDFWTINYLIENHDKSKLDSTEFDSYRKQFYPINDQEKENNKDNFERAWLHHQLNNPHHWQFWELIKKLPELKANQQAGIDHYLIEMICDWQAMGYKFGDTAYDYYHKNKDKIIIPEGYQEFVERILTKLKGGK
jgi:adenosyl cobinamide kinase/adenosyl cobinamide phosphate guanylyltransferase